MKTFIEQYQNEIEPNLQTIDLFIKTESPPYNAGTTAALLQIPLSELQAIMKDERLTELNRQAFFIIMKNGSSPLCKMFSRELDCGLPVYYTAEDISYIYNLDISTVISAAKSLGVSYFSRPMIYILFRQILINQ